SMKPVHAGLLGADALFLLDEAHLSQPFVTTVRDALGPGSPLRVQDRRHVEPFHVVTLSATQTDEAPPLVTSADREHPKLGPRLRFSKRATLVPVQGAADETAFTDRFAEEAFAASVHGGGPARIVGVVVNRVKRARRIFEALRKKVQDTLGDAFT